ncbi:MAG TPA: long-chain fatty acid--CoA ligase [Verrucomicrobiae bacterium]|nr:long-chain fatty acid--CoA ligase [Verrucomicrobiae bacterium]
MTQVNSLETFAARLLSTIESGAALDDGQFNELALTLFQLQLARNAAYRSVCRTRDVRVTTVTDWKQIPTVPAAGFKELEFSCIEAAERSRVFFSSGTTQQNRSRHFHHAGSLRVYEASLLSWFKLSMPAPMPSLVVALTPDGGQAPNSSLVHMFETLRKWADFETFNFSGTISDDAAWTLNIPATLGWLEKAIESNRPVLLLGTAFSYVHLLDYLRERSKVLALPGGSKILETGGYKGRSRTLPKPELHSLMSRYLGVQRSNIIAEYGMSELSSQAYAGVFEPGSIDGADIFRFPPWARALVVSPETGNRVGHGEPGQLKILDLANVYSVAAIQTEDLAIARREGFELLGRAAVAEPRGCSLMAAD